MRGKDCVMPESDSLTAEPICPRHGVVTLFGFGTKIFVDRGHLHIEDGIGAARRFARFSKVKHGLRLKLFSLYNDGFGNSARPDKLRKRGGVAARPSPAAS